MLKLRTLLSIFFTVLMSGSGTRTPTDPYTEINGDEQEDEIMRCAFVLLYMYVCMYVCIYIIECIRA